MARDHTRISLDIWGDDEWLDLPPHAQHLYFVLDTWPQLSFCGSGDWHPGKIAAKAKGWTAEMVCAAGQVLLDGLFLLVDTDTEEFLLRSWIKHDGLFRIPNMAVSMANARAGLSSRTLRAVVVHEVKKLKRSDPELGSWTRDQVAKMLAQKAVDPAVTDWPNLSPNPPVNPPPKGWVNPYDGGGVNPPPNPGPTPSPAQSPYSNSIEGYVNQVSHLDTEPPPRCPKHLNHTDPPACHGCREAREANKAWQDGALERKRQARAAAKAISDDCAVCGGTNWIPDTDPAVKCNHQEAVNE